ncbi:MAG: methionine adenosyltransferase domain-containing protein, partial [Acidobacteria bacterium]|nr:methionine adenosyltransferase domain-containing protein [Candidatus Polarisedimenticola svalbardensis]
DPHKVDRVGALRARQIAVRLARAGAGNSVTVWLGYLPGQETADFVHAEVDGEFWDEGRIGKAVTIPDLSLEGSFIELELASVKWTELLRNGYFGDEKLSWER